MASLGAVSFFRQLKKKKFFVRLQDHTLGALGVLEHIECVSYLTASNTKM
jgi:hypothetical protein